MASKYEVTRGSYVGTTDDMADRWYVERVDGPVDRRGPGYRTRREAREARKQMEELDRYADSLECAIAMMREGGAA